MQKLALHDYGPDYGTDSPVHVESPHVFVLGLWRILGTWMTSPQSALKVVLLPFSGRAMSLFANLRRTTDG